MNIQSITQQKPKLNPLSKETRIARRPQKPEELVDALQDPVHREIGRSKVARSIKVRRLSN